MRLAQWRGRYVCSGQVSRAGLGALSEICGRVAGRAAGAREWFAPMPASGTSTLAAVGVLGFSAGAHLAAALSTHFDKRLYDRVDAADGVSCRPDFAVIIYPGYLALAEQNFAANPEIHVTNRTPPTFIVQAEDDPVHVENSIVYFLALKNAKVPAEMHIYANGGHGYGLRRRSDLPVTAWPKLVETWLQTINMVAAP